MGYVILILAMFIVGIWLIRDSSKLDKKSSYNIYMARFKYWFYTLMGFLLGLFWLSSQSDIFNPHPHSRDSFLYFAGYTVSFLVALISTVSLLKFLLDKKFKIVFISILIFAVSFIIGTVASFWLLDLDIRYMT